MQPNLLFEKKYDEFVVAGIDEAGRGPLAGPVVACCAVLDQNNIAQGINDSKKLTKNQRQEIFNIIKNNVRYGIGIVDNEEIDQINILQATMQAMIIAYDDFVKKYNFSAQIILVDGNRNPFLNNQKFPLIVESKTIIKGDQKSLSIACASIIAKETRDQIMLDYHQKYPQYCFDQHAGYGTKKHLDKIKEFGICSIHRKTFQPIKTIIANQC
ncbi:ribonuclease HII [Alphaproteobacteria bacterium]|nr:ribonuclease HII [Alphaproteobacteria bacterium]